MFSLSGKVGYAVRAIFDSGFWNLRILIPPGVSPPFADRFISARKRKTHSGRTASPNLTTQNHIKHSIKNKTTRAHSKSVAFQLKTVRANDQCNPKFEGKYQ
jgi:hypothetical protein